MSVYDVIAEAIRRRVPISARYRGKPRVYCPHRLGWDNDGQRKALMYQIGGDSVTGLGPVGSEDNWRCVFLAELTDVVLIDEEWHTPANYPGPSNCMDHVARQV